MAVQGSKRKVVRLEPSPTLQSGKRVLAIESDELRRLEARLDENFEKAVDAILKCKGRVVVTGMGIVSSIGNNTQEVLASLREAKSGITHAEEFAKHGFRSNHNQ